MLTDKNGCRKLKGQPSSTISKRKTKVEWINKQIGKLGQGGNDSRDLGNFCFLILKY